MPRPIAATIHTEALAHNLRRARQATGRQASQLCLRGLLVRAHMNVVVVALAAKLARIA